ncbi:MAG: hypothetical protein KatS3mg031_1286 [Chitinophagales bacterium]|nr:MAG: hypothetical protein KatS3mg031_1286 [Chitinophagales bacterium]
MKTTGFLSYRMRRAGIRILLMLLIMGAFFNLSVRAETAQETFQKANQLYKEKKYSAAAALYDSLIQVGYTSPALYYNLGNACYKMGNIPLAILNYERAKKLAPSDKDIDFNLRLANLQVVDRVEPVPELFFVRWVKNFVASLSSDAWAMVALALIWTALLAGVLFLFIRNQLIRQISFLFMILTVLLSLSAVLLAWNQYRHQMKRTEAIVFAKNVYVKSAPDAQSTDLFILRQGTKIKLLEHEGDWQKIQLADGKEGWIKKEAMEII